MLFDLQIAVMLCLLTGATYRPVRVTLSSLVRHAGASRCSGIAEHDRLNDP